MGSTCVTPSFTRERASRPPGGEKCLPPGSDRAFIPVFFGTPGEDFNFLVRRTSLFAQTAAV